MKDNYAQIYKSIESIEKYKSKLIEIKQKSKKKRSSKFYVMSDVIIFGILFLIKYSVIPLFENEYKINDILITDILFLLILSGFMMWIAPRYFQYKLEPDDEMEIEFLRKDIRLLQHHVKKLNNKIVSQDKQIIEQDNPIDEIQETIDAIPSKETLDVLKFIHNFLQKMENYDISLDSISMEDKLASMYDQINEIYKKLGMFPDKNYYENKTLSKDDLEKLK